MSWLALVVVLGLALSNGANDNFKGVATIYGSGSASYRVSLAWATATTLAGSLFSLVPAAGLIKTFSGKGLVPDALCPPRIDTQGRRVAEEPNGDTQGACSRGRGHAGLAGAGASLLDPLGRTLSPSASRVVVASFGTAQLHREVIVRSLLGQGLRIPPERSRRCWSH